MKFKIIIAIIAAAILGVTAFYFEDNRPSSSQSSDYNFK